MLKLEIHNQKEEISRLETFLQEVSTAYSIDETMAFQINLALDEALANSVGYAYPEGTDGIVILEADKADDSVVFRLIDEGQPFDPTAQDNDVDITLSAEERPIGGLGIFLIYQMMDEVSYERIENRNVLTMHKKLQ